MYVETPYSTGSALVPRSKWQQLMDYVRIARFDHWFKNIFVLPGIVLAAELSGALVTDILFVSVLALLSAGFIASANYVINEWLDAPLDALHPLKRTRPGAAGRIKVGYVYLEYILFGRDLVSASRTRLVAGSSMSPCSFSSWGFCTTFHQSG